MSRDGYTYTETLPAMVVFCCALVPAEGHLPLVLRSSGGAEKKIYDGDCGFALEKLAYMRHNFTDVEVALGRFFMHMTWGPSYGK